MKSLSFIPTAMTAACLAAVLSCTNQPVTTGADSGGTTPGKNTGTSQSQAGDWAAIEKLEGEAKALAGTTGCTMASQCRTAPVGSRACGGPRYYLPYCTATTDSVALYRKLDEVAKAEQAYNAKYQIVSTCEFRMPPAVGLTGGACTAQ